MSSAQKTPIISASNTRKAIMYSLTRTCTDSQDARMQNGMRKVVSSTSGIDMPSMPSL